jgi:hypothetical protein
LLFPQITRIALFRDETPELCDRILILFVTSFDMDRGWSMTIRSTLPFLLFALALAAVARAGDQQTQQCCVNVVVCGLAVRSGLLANRRSDLQVRYDDPLASERRHFIGIGSDTVSASLS